MDFPPSDSGSDESGEEGTGAGPSTEQPKIKMIEIKSKVSRKKEESVFGYDC